MTYQILPEGDYLTGFHMGSWMEMREAYERMETYRKEHKIQTEGPYVERDVMDNLSVKRMEDYVTEIAVRIAEKEWS